MRLAAVCLALLTFAGCTLIDRSTFAPAPEAKAQPPAPPTAPIDARIPLLTIDYTVPSPDYTELLNYGVRAAEARDASVQYDVVSVLKDVHEAAAGQERATDVMRAIMRDHVPPDRIHLALRTDPSVAASQVRIYVR